MTTDITELAQSHELLIANGNETANLLRHLADNEIDSDYFAVVSECESYGKETDAELSITEFALRAAGYVDALVEALEKAQQAINEMDDRIRKQNRHVCELFDDGKALRERIAELESRTVKLPKRSVGEVMHMSGFSRDYAEGWCAGNDNAIHEIHNSGIKVEG